MQGGDGGEEVSTPFKFQKHTKQTMIGPQKKHKSDKHLLMDPLVLTKGDLDEICDNLRDTTSNLSSHFEQQYMQTLGVSRRIYVSCRSRLV